jgi:spore maturation protein CgeB
MSGGFYMVEHMEELEEFFVIGREIVCYRSKEELVDKIRYYLRHDGEREKIRQAGYQRCLRDHTWQKRLADAFCLMSVESMEEPSKRQYVP